MLKNRNRIASVTLAIGALTLLGPSAEAGVTRDAPRMGEDGPGSTRVPLCESVVVLTGTPFCPPLSPR